MNLKHFRLETNFYACTHGTAAKKTYLFKRNHEKSSFLHEIAVSCFVTRKPKSCLFYYNSKDKIENDIYADQTKCIGTFGDVF